MPTHNPRGIRQQAQTQRERGKRKASLHGLKHKKLPTQRRSSVGWIHNVGDHPQIWTLMSQAGTLLQLRKRMDSEAALKLKEYFLLNLCICVCAFHTLLSVKPQSQLPGGSEKLPQTAL